MQKLTKFLCGIVQQAAKIAEKSFNLNHKDANGDIITDCDKAVETFLIEKLTRKYPEFDIISEEINPAKTITSHCFVIDPIDGTKNFAAGISEWGIQIAAIENNEVVACTIYLPKFNELYYADESGAFLNGVRLEITPENHNQNQIFGMVFDGELPDLTMMDKAVNRDFRDFGSAAVSYGLVASGRLSGYGLNLDNLWDYLPGMYLVQMAGGFTTDEPGLHIAATNQKMLNMLSELSASVATVNQMPTDTVEKTTTKTKSAEKSTKSGTKKSK